jgi:predicted phosphodiesterase
MKIQIASDMHLEFPENRRWLRENPLEAKADLLILAGDTVPYACRTKADHFFDEISRAFQQVITIFGNHEFYRGEINKAYPRYEENIRENVVLLNNKTYKFAGMNFVCSTLWTAIPLEKQTEVEEIMNDYRMIKKRSRFMELINLDADETVFLYKKSLEYITKELDYYQNEPLVIITHHVPVFQTMPETYRTSLLRYGYGNDLKNYIEDHPNIRLWVHGHCHYPDMSRVGETIVVRNPLGYVSRRQQSSFKRDFIIEI